MWKIFIFVLLLLRLCFLEQFEVCRILRGRYRDFPRPATDAQPLPLSTAPTRAVHVLPLMNLHWHIIITHSPQFTLGFTLAVVYSVGLDKCMATYICYYSFIQSIFTALKIFYVLPIHPSPPPTPGKHWSFYWLHSFAFSRMSYSLNQTVCSPFRLAPFT